MVAKEPTALIAGLVSLLDQQGLENSVPDHCERLIALNKHPFTDSENPRARCCKGFE